MIDTWSQWLPDAKTMHISGGSLAKTLYRFPVDLLLTGDLGSGKTTFTQGLGKGLGIEDTLTSPTYALEQRYETSRGSLIHIDLYRLLPSHTAPLLAASDDHAGIRAIEWADRMGDTATEHPPIRIHLEEVDAGRNVTVTFEDLSFPREEEIRAWQKEVRLPAHIVAHCDAVAALCAQCASLLSARGIIIRPGMLRSAALVHDLLRFVDFRAGASPESFRDSAEDQAAWESWRTRYAGCTHERACEQFLRERGFPEVGSVVAVHGLQLPSPERATIEQQLLFYADKRMLGDRNVTLEERFADFAQRYGNGTATKEGLQWKAEAEHVERRLFPDGAPMQW